MNSDIRFTFKLPRENFVLDINAVLPIDGVTAFFGRSGSGKTSLLRCIAGFEQPENALLEVNGEIWHDSETGVFVPPHHRELGYVFQEGALFPEMTVKRNLLFGYGRTPKKRRKADFEKVVALLGLESLLDRLPYHLSGGEKQRTAIGRALLNHPRLLLMDEPMASLDQTHKKEILPYLENLHQNFSIPIIYITHDREEISHIADFIVLIDKGRLIAQGPLNQVFTSVDLPTAREQEAASVIEAEIVEHDPEFHLTKLSFAGGHLYVNRINKETGSRIRVRILAKDIGISRNPPRQTSILNILPAIIRKMQVHGRGRTAIQLDINGVPFLARITQKSQSILDLKEGDSVYAMFKSVAPVA